MKSAPKGKPLPRAPSVALLLLAICVIIGLCFTLYSREASLVEQRVRDRETVRASLLSQVLRSDLQSVADTLRLLADGDGLHAYLKTGLIEDLDRVVYRAVFVSRQQSSFDQVRYIDERGHEIVRVNHGGIVVPPQKLQDKSDRPYFLGAKLLAAGQILVSPFDLNIETGKIEEPFKPMLRFSTPVFDAEGKRRGVYVINYLGGDLIEHLRRAGLAQQHRLRLLNGQGYWLKAATPDQEWGFMLPARAGFSLAKTDPDLWARIRKEPEGQTRRAGGLFTWQRIKSQDLVGGETNGKVENEEFLIMGSEVSKAEWNKLFVGLKQSFYIVALVLTVLAASCIWFFRARKQAVNDLRRSEENLSVTLNSIGDAVMATDITGNITQMNPVAEHLTGWKLAEAQGRSIEEIFRIVHEFTRETAVIPVNAVLATGETQVLANHTLLISREGIEHSIADSAAPIRDRSGLVVGVVLVFRDVSKQRKAEDLQAQFAALVESSADAILSTSLDGKITSWNNAAAQMFGYSVTEAIGQSVTLLSPRDSSATGNSEIQFAAGQHTSHIETIRLQKGGNRLDVSIAISPITAASGRTVGMSQIIRDISARKRSETRVNELNAALRERAAQLEAVNTELESFSYSVSHDLRAPLRHVQGYVEMLTREIRPILSEKAGHYLSTISKAAQDMGELIDSLLAFSRMGRAEIREAVIDPAILIQEGRKAFELSTQNRNIRWSFQSMPKVLGDVAMIRQVFANLLDNAVKYTRNRTVAEITVGCAGEEDNRTIFFVRDNGAGFDLKYADKLFGIFQRLHRMDEFEGTGIGLANVRRIILRHGGRTWAEGKVGSGATFYFTLKLAPVAHSETTYNL